MDTTILDWIGYAASALVAISLAMSSIVKIRVINLIGALVFALYGFLLGAMPIFFVNTLISIINIYFLTKIFSQKNNFTIIEIKDKSDYLDFFINFHKKDIKKFFPSFEMSNKSRSGFYLLENTNIIGVLAGNIIEDSTFSINIDYVLNEYRDFKSGNFIFKDNIKFFKNLGYKKFEIETEDKQHIQYINQMGFILNPATRKFEKTLN